MFKHISTATPCCSYSVWHHCDATILSDTTITSNSGFSVVCHVGNIHGYGKASICKISCVTWENRDEYEMVKTAFQEEAVSCMQVLSGSSALDLDTHPYICGRKWWLVWMPFVGQKWWSGSRISWFGEIIWKTNISIRDVAEEQGISSGSYKGILTVDVGMRCMSANFIPQLLKAEQENCLSVSSDFLECAEAGKNFFKNSVTYF